MAGAVKQLQVADDWSSLHAESRERPPGEVYLTFDRSSGGLVIIGTGSQYELLVDERLVALVEIPAGTLQHDSINRIADCNLQELLPFWREGGSNGATLIERNLGPEWTLEDAGTAYLASHAGPGERPLTAVYHCPIEGSSLAIEAGETYCFQALVGLHRTRASMRIVFLDSLGKELDVRQVQSQSAFLGGRRQADYEALFVTATAPSRASHARLEIVKAMTVAGGDSFLFFAKPAFCRAFKAQDNATLMNELPIDMVAQFFAGDVPNLHYGQYSLPSEAMDGGWHELTVHDPISGASKAISVSVPETIRNAVTAKGLEAATLICEFKAPAGWQSPLAMSLWIDGLPSPGTHHPSGAWLRIPLPVAACDGRPHVFEVKLGASGLTLAQHAAMGPLSVTPWDALQKYAGQPLPAHLSPLAAHRYRSLAQAEAFRRTPDGPSLGELHGILLEGFCNPRKSFRVLPFPAVDKPDVSIVIPVRDQFDVTYVCLAALLFAATRASFEVIVVDDGSCDTTRDLPAIAPGVVYVKNGAALGFVGACNAGADRARGRHIVFLNNDTEPTANWLDELLFVFANNNDIGLAGAKLVYPDGKLQDAGGIVWESGDPWNYGRGANPHEPRFSYTRLCDYVSGAAIMIDAALWKRIGGFSREFMPAYFEDTDLAYKVRAAGRKVVFAPLSVVVHYEGLSNGLDENASSGLKRYQELNRPKFKRKWAACFEGGGKVGIEVDLAKDRAIRKRVLFIDYEVPQIDRDAGSYAALQEIRMFQALGAKVTFLPLNLAYMGRHTEHLQRLGVEVVYQPFVNGFPAFIKERGGEFDAIYITRYGVAENVLGHISDHARQARLIINVADLHFLRQIRDAMLTKDPARLAEALNTRETEIAILSRAELILSYSAVEQAVITSHVSTTGPKAGIVPWVVDPVPLRAPFAARSGIAFLGGYRHYPNVDAVQFFANEVMPLLRARLPGVPFLVYGSHVPPEIEALASDDVIVKGFVADVAEIFDTARLVVAPLLTGAGMKGKVLDYIAHGIPSVLSPVAAEGIGVRDGVEALLAQSPGQWTNAIATLYENEAEWTAMSHAAHAFAAKQYGFDKGVRGLSEALGLIDLHMTPGASAFHAASARPISPTAARPVTENAPHVPARTAK